MNVFVILKSKYHSLLTLSEHFSYVIFLISPLLNDHSKLLWLNYLPTILKAHVLEKNLNAFVHFFSKLNFQLSKNTGVDISNAVEQIDADTSTETADDKSKVSLEPDGFLLEEKREQYLLFTKKHLNPRLYQLELKYLSVPETIAPIERVFSQCSLIMLPDRAS
jgi:hypothetical protein